MNTAILMLASNSEAVQNIETAIEKLSEYFEIITQSSMLVTKAFGEQYKTDFHNKAIKLSSTDTSEETKAIFKQIEREMGRTPDSKKDGIIPIDIDLIFWNDTLLHDDYKRFDFVKQCVDEIKDMNI